MLQYQKHIFPPPPRIFGVVEVLNFDPDSMSDTAEICFRAQKPLIIPRTCTSTHEEESERGTHLVAS